MKYRIVLAVAVLAFASCKNEPQENPVETAPEISAEIPVTECFRGSLQQDTIAMTLVMQGDQITDGKLSYRYFEKDNNQGTLKGQIKGDTLFADYTFMSEGVTSVRQVAFLKQGAAYIEGYGDVKEQDGKMVFKDAKQLKFDSKSILSKIVCE